MFLSPLKLDCIRYQNRIEQGAVTKPLRVIGVDPKNQSRHDLVLKLRHPDIRDGHHEGTSLACELICSMIGRAIGLPVPDYAIIEVPEELHRGSRDESIRRLLQRNIGPNFGTIYLEGYHSWCPRQSSQLPVEIMFKLADTIAFDSTVINGDRKKTKPNLLWNGNKVYLIDHSLALPAHRWSDEEIDEFSLFPESQVQQHCTYDVLKEVTIRYDAILNSWQEKIKDDDLDELRAIIPVSWEQTKGDLDKIFRFLKARPKKFTEIHTNLTRILA